MIPKDYECDGQLNIWDFLSATSVCKHSGHTCNKAELWKVADSLDETQCPHVCCRKCNTRMCGARCNGSEEPEEKLPSLIEVVELVSRKFGLEFTEHKVDYLGPNSINDTVYRHRFYKNSVLEIDESNYLGEDRRHIGVDWEGKDQMTGTPCDTIEEVIQAVQKVIERSEQQSNVSKRRNR